MATAGDQIKRALRLLGVLAEGEAPSTETYADALAALNQMLDSWSTERLSVFGLIDTPATWSAGSDVYQIVTPSPIQLDPSTYFVLDGISHTPALINQAQYNSIPVKTVQSPIVSVLFAQQIINTDITLEIYAYPVPSQDLAFHFISVRPLTQVADVTDQLVVPQGYLRAFTYNLALELAPEFGVEPSKDVRRIAMSSKRNIKRINNPNDVMSLPLPLSIRSGRYNVYTG